MTTLICALTLAAAAIVTVFCQRLLGRHIVVHMLGIHRLLKIHHHDMLGRRTGIGHAITGLLGKRQRLAKISQ